MTENDGAAGPSPNPARRDAPLPQGYRQGIITAITDLLGFTLAFFNFWTFEAPGEWTGRSLAATITIVVAVALQIVALFRSLRLEDDSEAEYRKTVRWFVASAVVLLVGLLVTVAVFSA
jgi:hypothetical protein